MQGTVQKLHFILILQTVKPGRHSCPERGGGDLRPDPPFSLHYARIQNGWVCAFSALKIMCVCFFFKARQNKKSKKYSSVLGGFGSKEASQFPLRSAPKVQTFRREGGGGKNKLKEK